MFIYKKLIKDCLVINNSIKNNSSLLFIEYNSQDSDNKTKIQYISFVFSIYFW